MYMALKIIIQFKHTQVIKIIIKVIMERKYMESQILILNFNKINKKKFKKFNNKIENKKKKLKRLKNQHFNIKIIHHGINLVYKKNSKQDRFKTLLPLNMKEMFIKKKIHLIQQKETKQNSINLAEWLNLWLDQIKRVPIRMLSDMNLIIIREIEEQFMLEETIIPSSIL